MKLRVDFVTNSSSSSFCMYGIYVDDLSKLLGNIPEEELEKIEDEPYNYFEEKLTDSIVEYESIPDYDGFYIGRSWANIGDDETGRQFKVAVEEEIKKIFPEYAGEFTTHQEAWFDG